MSCDKCDCMDCRIARAVARAKSLASEVDNLSSPAWHDAEPANQVQAYAWGEAADDLLARYKSLSNIPLRTMVSMIMYKCNVRIENQARLSPQVERFLHENYVITQGKNGSVVEKLQYITMKSITGVPFTVPELMEKESFTIKSIKDDYTCPCGNNKCSKVEKSCWKCGAEIKP